MQPEERDPAYLWDMLEACREVLDMTKGVSLQRFLGKLTLLRATERSLEILGEAARRVSPAFQEAHPAVPWRQIIGQRNILALEYGQVDHDELYKTATTDIPDLIPRLEQLLPRIDENE